MFRWRSGCSGRGKHGKLPPVKGKKRRREGSGGRVKFQRLPRRVFESPGPSLTRHIPWFTVSTCIQRTPRACLINPEVESMKAFFQNISPYSACLHRAGARRKIPRTTQRTISSPKCGKRRKTVPCSCSSTTSTRISPTTRPLNYRAVPH